MQPKSERFEMRLDLQTLQQVESWRAEQPDRPSRAEAVRRLIGAGLAISGKDEMRLSAGEKVILGMLCHLCEHQGVRSDVDPEFVMDAIRGGHHWALEWEYPDLFHRGIDHPTVLAEVVDMLEMWYFMESGYEKLSEQERELVERDSAPLGKTVKFPGFDGNYETQQLGIAKFLVNRMGRFDRFKGRDLNSHAPLTVAYRRMLPVFESMRWSLTGGGELSGSQITALLQAMRSPRPPAES